MKTTFIYIYIYIERERERERERFIVVLHDNFFISLLVSEAANPQER